MQRPRTDFLTNRTVLNCLFFVFSLYLIFANINLFHPPVVEFEVETEQQGMFQIFWADSAGAYTEMNSVFLRKVDPSATHYSIKLRNPKGLVFGPAVKYLRIDPLEGPGKILIKNIRLRQGDLISITLDSRKDFESVKIIDGISDLKVTGSGLQVVADSDDPKLQVKVAPQFHYNTIIPLVLCCLLLLYTLKYFSLRFENLEYVEWLFFFIFALILTMAALTPPDMHPDEFVHRSAAEYYGGFSHWLPPAADDPEIAQTYSSHGVSRLNSREIVYLLAGKFMKFFSFIPVDHYLLLRYFNITLFSFLLIFCLKRPEFKIACLPIFISPQIWYVFSYFNSDGFAVFILFMISYQVMANDSLFNRYLRSENKSPTSIVQGIFLGLLFSFLFLIKKNFYFFFIFIVLYFVLQLYRGRYAGCKLILKRALLVITVLMSILAVHYTLHAVVNDWHRIENINKMQDRTADEDLNPLKDPKTSNTYLHIRGKGYPLSYVWKNMQWGHITFMSTFGVYGNMSLYNTLEFYNSIQLFLLLVSACILYDVLRSRLRDGNFLLLLMVIVCSSALIAASFINSWIADFQAQGRYLLPIVPMIGIFLYSARGILHRGRINFFVLVLFLFSSYSFVFLGLTDIPKL